MLAVLGLFGLFIVVSRSLEAHDYPAGDLRNEPLFWLAVGGVLGGLCVVALIQAIVLVIRARRGSGR
jgi:hypothetical protein